MARGNHDVRQVVERVHARNVHREHAVFGCKKLNLALFDLAATHMFAFAKPREAIRRFVFVKGVFVHFPNVEVVFPHGEQHRNVLFGDDMSFSKLRVLAFPGNDARQVMAKHVAYGIFCVDELHTRILSLFF